MEIFALKHDAYAGFVAGDGSYMNGELVNGIKSALWVERYTEPGEFELKAQPSLYLREALPIGSLISHSETLEVMIVEQHHIEQKRDRSGKETAELTISGRSFDAFLEQRAATNHHMGFETPMLDGTAPPYVFRDVTLWDLVAQLIDGQTTAKKFLQFEIPNTAVDVRVDATGVIKNREVKRGPLDEAVLRALTEFDGGLKTERPFNGVENIVFVVHDGEDLTGTVHFSYGNGDLSEIEYLWGDQKNKTAAYAVSRYGGNYVNHIQPWALLTEPTQTGLRKRVMWIEANDSNIRPVSSVGKMNLQKVLKQRALRDRHLYRPHHMVTAKVASASTKKYRVDYNIGDIVRVIGDYGVDGPMRITEYAEVDDEEDGSSGYPTLSRLEIEP